jgi:CheY-like chemotaxis protein
VKETRKVYARCVDAKTSPIVLRSIRPAESFGLAMLAPAGECDIRPQQGWTRARTRAGQRGGRAAGRDGRYAQRLTGKGAEFMVTSPLEQAEGPRPNSGLLRSRGDRSKVLRVLLIEDHADTAESLKEALELNGHQVEVAGTGLEGIEKARTFHPDVILCDLGLPGMDGLEVARRMRSDPELRASNLIAFSGYARAEDVDKSKQAGFVQHLAKPADVDALESTLLEVAATA